MFTVQVNNFLEAYLVIGARAWKFWGADMNLPDSRQVSLGGSGGMLPRGIFEK